MRDHIQDAVLEKLLPNQEVFALTDHTGALQNCMSLITKAKEVSKSESVF